MQHDTNTQASEEWSLYDNEIAHTSLLAVFILI